MTKILVVEDEAVLRDTLQYNLARQGYEVITSGDGREGLGLARRVKPDLMVLDLMLPGLDGLEVCRVMRQENNTPILMLTAKTTEVDKIVGLEVGADDYMTKPFSMRELLARVKAMLRRVKLERGGGGDASGSASDGKTRLVFDDLVLDGRRGEVTLAGRPLRLKPKEYELLRFLARNRGAVLSRDLILERVWGWDFAGGSRTVDVHVRWLREKLERDPSSPTRIVTVRGMGYRFEG